jgi:hypothetical protein
MAANPKDDTPSRTPKKSLLERDHLRNVKLQQANRMRQRIQDAEKASTSDPNTEDSEQSNIISNSD